MTLSSATTKCRAGENQRHEPPFDAGVKRPAYVAWSIRN